MFNLSTGASHSSVLACGTGYSTQCGTDRGDGLVTIVVVCTCLQVSVHALWLSSEQVICALMAVLMSPMKVI